MVNMFKKKLQECSQVIKIQNVFMLSYVLYNVQDLMSCTFMQFAHYFGKNKQVIDAQNILDMTDAKFRKTLNLQNFLLLIFLQQLM